MVRPLSGLRRLLASVRIWPDERLRGWRKWLHHNRLSGSGWKCCPLPPGEGLGARAVTVAFRLQSALEEALIIGQEEKSTAFLG